VPIFILYHIPTKKASLFLAITHFFLFSVIHLQANSGYSRNTGVRQGRKRKKAGDCQRRPGYGIILTELQVYLHAG
jgi:hypothetical protein